MKTNRFENEVDALSALSEALTSKILETKEKPVLLFLSGGSSLGIIPFLEKDFFVNQDTLEYLTIGFADDRFDVQNSNFVVLKNKYPSFMNKCNEAGIRFVDTSPHLSDQFAMADWYDGKIRELVSEVKNNNGKVIIQLGMGKDGHIAGIFPFSETSEFDRLFVQTPRYVVGLDATGKSEFNKRFTLTPSLFHQADVLFLYFSGEEKANVFNNAGSLPYWRCPVELVKQMEEKLYVYSC